MGEKQEGVRGAARGRWPALGGPPDSGVVQWTCTGQRLSGSPGRCRYSRLQVRSCVRVTL